MSAHHGAVFVCIAHREVSHWGSCPVCGKHDLLFHPRWRAPKRNNDVAWKRIANGEYNWDRKAVAKKKRRWQEHMDAYWELLKRKNPKAKRPFGR